MVDTPTVTLQLWSLQDAPQVLNQQIVEKRKQLAVFFFDGRHEGQPIRPHYCVEYQELIRFQRKIHDFMTPSEHYLEQLMPAGEHLMDPLKIGLPFDASQMHYLGTTDAVTLDLKGTGDENFEVSVFWYRKPNAAHFRCSATREMLLQMSSCIRLWLAPEAPYE